MYVEVCVRLMIELPDISLKVSFPNLDEKHDFANTLRLPQSF